MSLAPRLICPRCRRIENEQFIYHALKRHDGEDARGLGALGDGDGVLVCGGCGTKYPVVEGVAVVFREVGAVDGVVSPPWWPHGWGGGCVGGDDGGEGFGRGVWGDGREGG